MAIKTSVVNDNGVNSPKALAKIVQRQLTIPPNTVTRRSERKWDCQMDGNGVYSIPKAATMSTYANGTPPITPPFLPLLALMLLTVPLREKSSYENK